MDSSGVGGRRRTVPRCSAEDQALDQIAKEAEARLAARRQARVEAREIRMRELERAQKDQDETADRAYDMQSANDPILRGNRSINSSINKSHGNSLSSRRSSEDSLEDGQRDAWQELRNVEERFRKAMIANAQLDNDKAAASYQLQLHKDRLEDLEEAHSQLQREHKEKCRECEQLRRSVGQLQEELSLTKGQLDERDELIAEQGLVIVGGECDDETREPTKRTLVTKEGAALLAGAGEGSLDYRLRSFAEERKSMQEEIQNLQQELQIARSSGKRGVTNGPLGEFDDIESVQREANKQLSEMRFKLQKSEQETSSLQAVVARLESQVVRYKSAAEASEKSEEALKTDRRKLQREHREAQARVEELETANNHLLKRLDKLKNAKSALLKDL
uniref:Putative lrrfip family n=1 Tax=Xenopsylla cheopis TaxID=163159 RepID=A0A6M2DLU5_XENCH